MKQIKNKNTKKNVHETKRWYFEKIDKPLVTMTKKKKIQITRIRNKRGHSCQPYRNEVL